jgi:hypothetical protein
MKAALCGLTLAALVLSAPRTSFAATEVKAGTRFLVELRNKLDAKKVKVGKKFEVRTLEAIQAEDGSYIPAGAKLKGRVSYVEVNKLSLRFERIETGREKLPVVAHVVGVVGEKGVKKEAGKEGEVEASKGRARGAVTGAAIGAGVGAGVGAATGGGKGAGIGAGVGAAAGGVIGALTGTRDLVLDKGSRLEIELDRPLLLQARR